eukprot:68869-Chlamydomonas_euryale.AAC.2
MGISLAPQVPIWIYGDLNPHTKSPNERGSTVCLARSWTVRSRTARFNAAAVLAGHHAGDIIGRRGHCHPAEWPSVRLLVCHGHMLLLQSRFACGWRLCASRVQRGPSGHAATPATRRPHVVWGVGWCGVGGAGLRLTEAAPEQGWIIRLLSRLFPDSEGRLSGQSSGVVYPDALVYPVLLNRLINRMLVRPARSIALIIRPVFFAPGHPQLCAVAAIRASTPRATPHAIHSPWRNLAPASPTRPNPRPCPTTYLFSSGCCERAMAGTPPSVCQPCLWPLPPLVRAP